MSFKCTGIHAGREDMPEDILSKEQIDLIAEKLGGDWKKLGTELNFPEDDMTYFESENSEETACAKKMLTIWQVGDWKYIVIHEVCICCFHLMLYKHTKTNILIFQ